MAQVLLVEDDASIRIALTKALTALGHTMETVTDGASALRRVASGDVDLIVLDLGLPDIDGWEVLRMVRGASQVPVIVATARDDDVEVVRTLDAGADDYVIKPFTAQQLNARIGAVLRRAGDGPAVEPVVVGGLKVDPRTREASLDGEPLDLTVKEFDLLHYLAERPGTVVAKRELLASVWRQPAGGADKTVDVHLSWLRRKLGEAADKPRYLRTIRGAGVKLVAPTD
ncbi:MAG: response regulator transcription factor [Nocardioidaceae bacterium]